MKTNESKRIALAAVKRMTSPRARPPFYLIKRAHSQGLSLRKWNWGYNYVFHDANGEVRFRGSGPEHDPVLFFTLQEAADYLRNPSALEPVRPIKKIQYPLPKLAAWQALIQRRRWGREDETQLRGMATQKGVKLSRRKAKYWVDDALGRLRFAWRLNGEPDLESKSSAYLWRENLIQWLAGAPSCYVPVRRVVPIGSIPKIQDFSI